ncbi:hypothetical protein EV187_2746 [Agromyces ramosus]|uniref:Polyketide cyclase/dehydrase/lipid transport protein n=1 Tax=Agromyces ramosus TaxID=33879 RepID=A0A4Q7M9L8_9MICO|nr:hypothetical protein [Agromyces ramosus]RZS64361.1 hypothetical protein EV187_2746 [Agromyces ramosus]
MSIGSRTIAAPAEPIRGILLRPLALPEWNPAFLAIGGSADAAIGHIHSLTVTGGLRGEFRYTAIEPTHVDMEWNVPGMLEHCSWVLEPERRGTRVSHEVQRTGPLAIVFRSQTEALPRLRLDRLSDVATGRTRLTA